MCGHLESESGLLAKYAYTYKEFDSGFYIAVSVLTCMYLAGFYCICTFAKMENKLLNSQPSWQYSVNSYI